MNRAYNSQQLFIHCSSQFTATLFYSSIFYRSQYKCFRILTAYSYAYHVIHSRNLKTNTYISEDIFSLFLRSLEYRLLFLICTLANKWLKSLRFLVQETEDRKYIYRYILCMWYFEKLFLGNVSVRTKQRLKIFPWNFSGVASLNSRIPRNSGEASCLRLSYVSFTRPCSSIETPHVCLTQKI
jgi:hypothetical protein